MGLGPLDRIIRGYIDFKIQTNLSEEPQSYFAIKAKDEAIKKEDPSVYFLKKLAVFFISFGLYHIEKGRIIRRQKILHEVLLKMHENLPESLQSAKQEKVIITEKKLQLVYLPKNESSGACLAVLKINNSTDNPPTYLSKIELNNEDALTFLKQDLKKAIIKSYPINKDLKKIRANDNKSIYYLNGDEIGYKYQYNLSSCIKLYKGNIGTIKIRSEDIIVKKTILLNPPKKNISQQYVARSFINSEEDAALYFNEFYKYGKNNKLDLVIIPLLQKIVNKDRITLVMKKAEGEVRKDTDREPLKKALYGAFLRLVSQICIFQQGGYIINDIKPSQIVCDFVNEKLYLIDRDSDITLNVYSRGYSPQTLNVLWSLSSYDIEYLKHSGIALQNLDNEKVRKLKVKYFQCLSFFQLLITSVQFKTGFVFTKFGNRKQIDTFKELLKAVIKEERMEDILDFIENISLTREKREDKIIKLLNPYLMDKSKNYVDLFLSYQ